MIQHRFTRLEASDRAQALVVYNSIFVRRLERDDAPRSEDGSFAVECEHKWPSIDIEWYKTRGDFNFEWIATEDLWQS